MFARSCSLSQLPTALDLQGKVDTLLYVCHDLTADGVRDLSLTEIFVIFAVSP